MPYALTLGGLRARQVKTGPGDREAFRTTAFGTGRAAKQRAHSIRKGPRMLCCAGFEGSSATTNFGHPNVCRRTLQPDSVRFHCRDSAHCQKVDRSPGTLARRRCNSRQAASRPVASMDSPFTLKVNCPLRPTGSPMTSNRCPSTSSRSLAPSRGGGPTRIGTPIACIRSTRASVRASRCALGIGL